MYNKIIPTNVLSNAYSSVLTTDRARLIINGTLYSRSARDNLLSTCYLSVRLARYSEHVFGSFRLWSTAVPLIGSQLGLRRPCVLWRRLSLAKFLNWTNLLQWKDW